MDPIQESLLTSSDYEHLIEDLRADSNSFQLHSNQEYLHVEKSEPHIMVQDEANLPILEDYTHVQNHGKHIDNELQTHGDPALENYMREETRDVMDPGINTTALEVPPVPFSPTCTIPCRDNYLGPLSFEVLLDSTSSHRRSWVYSHTLNKVYIDVNKSLLVQFRIQGHMNGLSVRALPVYSMDDYISTPVQRCRVHSLQEDVLNHAHSKDPPMCFCANFRWVRHVVRSNHSQAQYDYDLESDRHSVRVPLEVPQAGCDTAMVQYHFSCKTSCPTGMNRKPIDVVFTLETEQCEVLGRFVLPVKICSCPKRDKEKEEQDAEARNGDPLQHCGPGKRRMSSCVEKNEDSRKIKIEHVTPQKDGATLEETNVEKNNVELPKVLNTLISQNETLISQNVQLSQQLRELKAESITREEMKAELIKQREEMKAESIKLRDEMKAELDIVTTNNIYRKIEPMFKAIYHLLRKD